ncbi:MAG: hypothetical protein ACI3Y0_12535 [Prevotella sp.]
MKKTILSLVAALAMATAAQADEYVFYQPKTPVKVYKTSDSDNNEPSIKFTGLSAGDVIKFHVTNVNSSGDEVIFRGSSQVNNGNWAWGKIAKIEDGIATYTIPNINTTIDNTEYTPEQILYSLRERGLTLCAGDNKSFNLLAITVEDNSGKIKDASQTLRSESLDATSGWTSFSLTLTGDYSLAQLKAGDIIRVNYKTDSSVDDSNKACLTLEYKDGNNETKYIFEKRDLTKAGETGDYEYTLTADDVTALQSGNYLMYGYKLTINKVEVVSTNKILEKDLSKNLPFNFGSWQNYDITKEDYIGINVGDVLNISYEVPDDYNNGEIYLRNTSESNWVNIKEIKDLSGTGTAHFYIDADLLALLQTGNLKISGSGGGGTDNTNGVKLTKLSVTHFITEAGYRPVYIPASQYATFYGASTLALPDGVEAYYVSSTTDDSATLTNISNIPANQGVILKGNEGIYQLYTTTDDGAVSVSGNLLCGSTTRTQITDTNNKYVLYSDDNGDPEFRKIKTETYLDAYKCYLNTQNTTNAARLCFFFGDGETTNVNIVQGEKAMMDGSVFYDMQGRRVATPTKGLYIVNGKKVLIK